MAIDPDGARSPNPVISVCIAVRDRPQMLLVGIRSVLEQGDHVEVVVADDGSQAPIDEVLRSEGLLDDERVVFVRQPPLGIAAARNACIRLARGEHVMALDSDDVLLPGAIDRISECLQRPFVDWVYCDYEEIRNGRRVRIRLPDYENPEHFAKAILARPRIPFKHSGTTARRSILLALGGYDEDLPIKVDIELYLRALERGVRPVRIPEPLVLFRDHPGSVSRNRLQGLRVWMRLIDKYGPDGALTRGMVKAARFASELGKSVSTRRLGTRMSDARSE